MTNLNHFICPRCGHDFHTDCAYATCDACGCFFYASQSKTCLPEQRSLTAAEQKNLAHVYKKLRESTAQK